MADDKCGCPIRSIRFCLNTSIHYFVVLSLVREPLKRKRSSFRPTPSLERLAHVHRGLLFQPHLLDPLLAASSHGLHFGLVVKLFPGLQIEFANVILWIRVAFEEVSGNEDVPVANEYIYVFLLILLPVNAGIVVIPDARIVLDASSSQVDVFFFCHVLVSFAFRTSIIQFPGRQKVAAGETSSQRIGSPVRSRSDPLD